MINQITLGHSVQATGVGVHTGQPVLITLRPALPNTGIVFRRVDLDPVVDIPAKLENIDASRAMSTALSCSGATVGTVEHLMSAFFGLGGELYGYRHSPGATEH